MASIAALMMSLTYAGDDDVTKALIAGGFFIVCLRVLFVMQEKRATEPMISFALWSRRPIAACNGSTVLLSA
jgi:hypothetical protein